MKPALVVLWLAALAVASGARAEGAAQDPPGATADPLDPEAAGDPPAPLAADADPAGSDDDRTAPPGAVDADDRQRTEDAKEPADRRVLLIDPPPPPEAELEAAPAAPPAPSVVPAKPERVLVPAWEPDSWQQSIGVGSAAALGVLFGGLPFGVLLGASVMFIPILTMLRGNDPTTPLVLTGSDATLQGNLLLATLYAFLAAPVVAMLSAGLFAFAAGWFVGDLLLGAGAGFAAAGAVLPTMFAASVVTTFLVGAAAIGVLTAGGATSSLVASVAIVVVVVGWPTVFVALEAAGAAAAALAGYWGAAYARHPMLNDDSKDFYELDDPDTDLLPDSSFDLRASPPLLE